MSFLEFINKIKCRTDSLQAGIEKRVRPKRTSLSISPGGPRAGVSVEAALVMPVFLFFVLNLVSVIGILSSYVRIQSAVQETGMKLADYAYVRNLTMEKLPDWLDIAPRKLTSVLSAKTMVENQLGGDKQLDYYQTSILQEEDEIVDIVVKYPVQPMFGMAGFGRFNMINRCRVKGFCGYRLGGGQVTEDGEEIVYITETGTVYHRDRSCSFLKLSIKTILPSSVESARNEDGGKYYPCERCKGESGGHIYYITEHGDRYHTTVNCSGLKRTVIEILLSRVGDRTPCSRCGG